MGRRIIGALPAGAFFVLYASQAAAQLVGTYSGTQANGATISVTIEQNRNALYLSGVGVGIMTSCPDSEAINENVGLGIEPIKIDSPTFSFKLLANPELFVSASMVFDNATKSVKGTFTADVPALDIFTKHPKKSETCVSKQGFTASMGDQEKARSGSPSVVIYQSGAH